MSPVPIPSSSRLSENLRSSWHTEQTMPYNMSTCYTHSNRLHNTGPENAGSNSGLCNAQSFKLLLLDENWQCINCCFPVIVYSTRHDYLMNAIPRIRFPLRIFRSCILSFAFSGSAFWFNRPTNQSTNQPNKQTNKQTSNQAINQSINQKCRF